MFSEPSYISLKKIVSWKMLCSYLDARLIDHKYCSMLSILSETKNQPTTQQKSNN